MLFLKIATILVVVIIPTAFCIKACGLEHVKRCDPTKSCCAIDVIEPALRKWFSKGRPDYFINESLDPLILPVLTVEFNDYTATLKNVVITGLENSVISDYRFSYKDRYMQEYYTMNVCIESEKYTLEDPDNNLVEHSCHFSASIKDLTTFIYWNMTIVHRCDGNRFMVLEPKYEYTPVPLCNIVVKKGYSCLCPNLEAAYRQSLAQVVRDVSIKAFGKGYEGFCKHVPMDEYFIVPADS